MRDGTDAGDIPGDVTWMSYAELGQARGISAASAKRLSNRRRWSKRAGNDGTTRVAVPAAEALPRETAPGDVARDVPGDVSHLVQEANARADEANRRADVAIALADRTLVQLGEATARGDQAEARAGQAERDLAAERARADRAELALDRAESELEAAQAAQVQAEAAIEELRQADAVRKGQGRWARLKAAWWGE